MSPKPPVFHELLPVPDVMETFESILRLPYPILFDSATARSPISQYSFVAADPVAIMRAKGERVELNNLRAGTIVQKRGRALDFVTELLNTMRLGQDDCGEKRQAPVNVDSDVNLEDIPPFRGGAAGYIGYEYGSMLEHLPRPDTDDIAIPDVVIGLYGWVIAWNHIAQRAWIIGNDKDCVGTVIKLLEKYSRAPVSDRQNNTGCKTPDNKITELCTQVTQQQYESTFTSMSYPTAVQKVQEHIIAGDIFQVNLSQRFKAPLPCYSEKLTYHTQTTYPAWKLYQRLRAINPAPFASYFDFGDGVIVSASPERFLLTDIDGRVETRPIKGTRASATTEEMDVLARDELIRSEKDAAEHVMIVDVLRNDLARVCLHGSINVRTLSTHERYATVHHLVSTIVGQLRPDMHSIDLLHACFPGGSITGAPKIRAMEIIAQLEPVTRSAYCGTIGYFSTTGAMDTSILIRTYIVKDGNVYFSAGGGIVADSDPVAEYDETLIKARALMWALHE